MAKEPRVKTTTTVPVPPTRGTVDRGGADPEAETLAIPAGEPEADLRAAPRRRVAIVGGGLAGGLLAYRLSRLQPDVEVRVFEAEASLGGNHVWCFHETDLDAEARSWMEPFLAARWASHEVRFPDYRRELSGGYFAVTSEQFHRVVLEELGDRVHLETRIRQLSGTAVLPEGGEPWRADVVFDARGPEDTGHFDFAWQKFVGRTVELAAPHGLARPIIMDATVPQRDGYRFFYALPFSETALLIEDTRYADGPELDEDEYVAEIDAYAAERGWKVRDVVRTERGVLPITLSGDPAGFWASRPAGVIPIGLRAGLFHPTTGYSLLEAVWLADRLAASWSVASFSPSAAVRARADDLWRRGAYFRRLNRMLFRAAEPDRRYVVMQRFYRLPEALIARFYAARLTLGDRLRILSGRPPVSVLRALPCVPDRRPSRS